MDRTFGVVMKELRHGHGWTLERVGKKLGCSKGYMSGIETDEVDPPAAPVVRKIARLFGVDVVDLMRLAWLPKVPKELRRFLNASQNQPVADTPITTEAAIGVFKEIFTREDITASNPLSAGSTTTDGDHEGEFPVPDTSVPVRPVEGSGSGG